MCWCVVIYFIIYEYRAAFLFAVLLFCQPVLLMPFLCTCSLDYLPRLLWLSRLIITLSYRSLCSLSVLFRGSHIRNKKKNKTKCINYSTTLSPSRKIYFWCECACVLRVVVCGCLRVSIHACDYLEGRKWRGKNKSDKIDGRKFSEEESWQTQRSWMAALKVQMFGFSLSSPSRQTTSGSMLQWGWNDLLVSRRPSL